MARTEDDVTCYVLNSSSPPAYMALLIAGRLLRTKYPYLIVLDLLYASLTL